MKKSLDLVLTLEEWGLLASGLVICAGIYLVVIRPAWIRHAGRAEAQVARQAADDELRRTRSKLEKLEHEVARTTRRLAEMGGAPPAAGAKDLQIARITALAERSAFTIDRVSPIFTVQKDDHHAVFVQFTGRVAFPDLRRFFQRLEESIDFVDVTHFAITSVQSESSPICTVSWSARINTLPLESSEPTAAVRPGLARGPSSEVIRRVH